MLNKARARMTSSMLKSKSSSSYGSHLSLSASVCLRNATQFFKDKMKSRTEYVRAVHVTKLRKELEQYKRWR